MGITRRRLLVSTSTAALAAVTPPWLLACGSLSHAPSGLNLPIGMNLAGIADWEIGFPFRNLVWGARKWMTRPEAGGGPWDTNKAGEMAVTPQGYPAEAPFTAKDGSTHLPFTLLPSVRPNGRYVALWDGDGELDASLNAKIVEQAKGRAVIEIKVDKPGEGAVVLAIKRSKKGDPLRNLRVVAEADEKIDLAKEPFLPEFLAFIKPFHALRFMDWQGTNNSIQSKIEDRKKLDTYTMVATGGDKPDALDRMLSGGVAWELIADVCNRAGTDAWVCVPHLADDEYIRRMAAFFKRALKPERKLYLEFSNEIWNWQFGQAQWMLRDKQAGDGAAAWGYEAWDKGDPAKGVGHPERTAWLFRRAFDLWEKEWTGADRKRLVRVVGVQHGWFDTGDRTVRTVMEHGGADAVAPAGYFGPNDEVYGRWQTAGAALTPAAVMKDMEAVLDKESGPWTKAYADLAKKHKLRLVVYEGGQHIQPKGQAETPYMPALRAVQFEQGMADVYGRNLKMQKDAGVDLFMAFSSVGAQGSKYGSWGHAESYSSPLSKSPKLRAILEANAPRKP